jgi:hypothetical protein
MCLTSAIVAIVLAHIPRIIPTHSFGSIPLTSFLDISIAQILVLVKYYFKNFEYFFREKGPLGVLFILRSRGYHERLRRSVLRVGRVAKKAD